MDTDSLKLLPGSSKRWRVWIKVQAATTDKVPWNRVLQRIVMDCDAETVTYEDRLTFFKDGQSKSSAATYSKDAIAPDTGWAVLHDVLCKDENNGT